MKKKTFYLRMMLALITTLGVVSCSNDWIQNPLANKDRAFQSPQRQPPPREKPTGIESDYVRLEHPEYFTFSEGVESSYPLSGRVLLEGYTPRIVIQNLAEFKGATFDEASGQFTWKPAVGTVSSRSPVAKATLLLKVMVIGQGASPEDVVVSNEFILPLEVGKVIGVPEIFSVSQRRLTLREGDSASLTLFIRDPDADANTLSTWPTLQFLPKVDYPSLAPFVSITSFGLTSRANEFKVELKINLARKEVTSSKSIFAFGLQAYSRFNEGSPRTDIEVSVVTSFSTLQSTWFETLPFSAETPSEYQFLIYDPKEELIVNEPRFKNLPVGVSIKCEGGRLPRQLCKLSWKPESQSPVGEVTIQAKVESRNQDSSDLKIEDQAFEFKMKVLPKVDLPKPPEAQEPAPEKPASENLSMDGGLL